MVSDFSFPIIGKKKLHDIVGVSAIIGWLRCALRFLLRFA